MRTGNRIETVGTVGTVGTAKSRWNDRTTEDNRANEGKWDARPRNEEQKSRCR